MSILDNIRFLYCLNESGVDKAHDLLTELVTDPQYQRVTLDQLFDETDNIIHEAESNFQKEDEEKKLELSNRKQEIEAQYSEEFRILGHQNAFWKQKEMLESINDYEDDPCLRLVDTYNWGYIQGIRAERARRKKVSHE